jgi:hypothetical protein
MNLLYRLNPAIPQRFLFMLAGAAWTAAGLILVVRTIPWFGELPGIVDTLLVALSVAAAAAGHTFLFSRLVEKNVERILALPERVCLFAFTAWRGYAMIALMVTIGISLRSSPLPRYFLAVPYAAMGLILLAGSIRFFREYFQLALRRPS